MHRNIFCLESQWDNNLEKKLSVLPLLELAEKTCSINFIHLTCNTFAEFKYNLGLRPNRKSYGLLYLAFHGTKGTIQLHEKEHQLGFDELAKMFGSKFSGWALHFGSCSTLKNSEELVRTFMHETGIKLVTGYCKNVEWVESSALDLIIFSRIQRYKNLKSFLNFIYSTYPDLVEFNGFEGISQ
ncbi:hypothetical protein BH10ACI2_BH10ACI2_19480 [soil metagenome]